MTEQIDALTKVLESVLNTIDPAREAENTITDIKAADDTARALFLASI